MRRILLGLGFVWLSAPIGTTADPVDFLSSASCATSTCHGGVIDQGPMWNHSLSTWMALDPHAGAGTLLRDRDSRLIVQQLLKTGRTVVQDQNQTGRTVVQDQNQTAADEQVSAEAYDEVLRKRCISCHTTATAEQCEGSGLLDDALLAAGVSCAACHGSAEKWLEPHVQASWKQKGEKRFAPETGMTDTESINGRAETCVRCHIGSRSADGLTRDMNHDLIAAGHPALRFDLLIYNENLPHHWDSQSESEKKFNESAVRVRKVGRAINLAAAASLASERATAALSGNAPWPELADYDCFACHQSLSMREYQLPPTKKSRDNQSGNKSPLHVSDGLPVWNAWHSVNQFDMRDKRNVLETLSPHKSVPANVARISEKIASEYRKYAASQMTADLDPAAVLESPMKQLVQEPPVDWHQAAIQYLEIDAALRDMARQEATAAVAKQRLEQLRGSEQLLRFDQDRSEDQFARYHSPAKFDPDKFRTRMLDLLGVQPATKPAASTNN